MNASFTKEIADLKKQTIILPENDSQQSKTFGVYLFSRLIKLLRDYIWGTTPNVDGK